MSKSRSEFLTQSSLGLFGASFVVRDDVLESPHAAMQEPTPAPTPGAPSAFRTGPAVGPQVSTATFAEGEKLMQVQLTVPGRALAAESWRVNLERAFHMASARPPSF